MNLNKIKTDLLPSQGALENRLGIIKGRVVFLKTTQKSPLKARIKYREYTKGVNILIPYYLCLKENIIKHRRVGVLVFM